MKMHRRRSAPCPVHKGQKRKTETQVRARSEFTASASSSASHSFPSLRFSFAVVELLSSAPTRHFCSIASEALPATTLARAPLPSKTRTHALLQSTAGWAQGGEPIEKKRGKTRSTLVMDISTAHTAIHGHHAGRRTPSIFLRVARRPCALLPAALCTSLGHIYTYTVLWFTTATRLPSFDVVVALLLVVAGFSCLLAGWLFRFPKYRDSGKRSASRWPHTTATAT